jgi:tetratricopeptide (TPR) repeat protein
MVVSLKYVGLSSVMIALAMIQSPSQAAMTGSTTLPITQDVAKTSGNSLQEQGRRFYEQGKYIEAIAQWQQLRQTAERQGDRLTVAQALNFLSMAQQQLGQWKQAKTTIEQSKTLLKAEQNVDALIWAQTLNTQANLQLLTGQTRALLQADQRPARHLGQPSEPGPGLAKFGVLPSIAADARRSQPGVAKYACLTAEGQ